MAENTWLAMALSTLDSEALVSLEVDLRVAITNERRVPDKVPQPPAGTHVFGTLDQFYAAVRDELLRRGKNVD